MGMTSQVTLISLGTLIKAFWLATFGPTLDIYSIRLWATVNEWITFHTIYVTLGNSWLIAQPCTHGVLWSISLKFFNPSLAKLPFNFNGSLAKHGSQLVQVPIGDFNSLWPSDAIWWHRSGSTWAQLLACCLTAPSHYLNQCWLIISKVPVAFTWGYIIRKSEGTDQ